MERMHVMAFYKTIVVTTSVAMLLAAMVNQSANATASSANEADPLQTAAAQQWFLAKVAETSAAPDIGLVVALLSKLAADADPTHADYQRLAASVLQNLNDDVLPTP